MHGRCCIFQRRRFARVLDIFQFLLYDFTSAYFYIIKDEQKYLLLILSKNDNEQFISTARCVSSYLKNISTQKQTIALYFKFIGITFCFNSYEAQNEEITIRRVCAWISTQKLKIYSQQKSKTLELQYNNNQIIVMGDSDRSKRVLNTINTVKRQQKRRLTAISYYSDAKDLNFGSLLQLIRFWEKQVRNQKLAEKANLNFRQSMFKTQYSKTIGLDDFKQVQNEEKPAALSSNVFRVRFSSHCEKLKTYSLRKAQQSKIRQLSVFSKTITDRTPKMNKQTDIMANSNEKLAKIRVPNIRKSFKLKKEIFQDEQKLTPW